MPDTLPRVSRGRGMRALVLFYAVTVLSRSLVVSVLPALAWQLMGSSRDVSAFYLAASALSFGIGILLPRVAVRLGLRRVALAAGLAGAVSGLAMGVPVMPFLLLAITTHMLMVLLFENATSLGTMALVPRRARAGFEAWRVMAGGVAFIIGPLAGTALADHGVGWLAGVASIACAVMAALILLRVPIRQASPPALTPVVPAAELPLLGAPASVQAAARPGGAAAMVFMRNRGLRNAWLLAIGRATWWQMMFVYTPLLILSRGMDPSRAGIIVAAICAMLLLAPIWHQLLHAFGLRRVLFLAYLLCGGATAATGLLAGLWMVPAIAALMVAAVAMSVVDSTGNAAFLRALRPRDAPRMSPIYNTFRDISQIVPVGVYTALLAVLDVAHVFTVTGAMLMTLSVICLRLPRRA